jgi:hypothetical protein
LVPDIAVAEKIARLIVEACLTLQRSPYDIIIDFCEYNIASRARCDEAGMGRGVAVRHLRHVRNIRRSAPHFISVEIQNQSALVGNDVHFGQLDRAALAMLIDLLLPRWPTTEILELTTRCTHK